MAHTVPPTRPVDLDDELNCPFCAAPTEIADQRCPACKQALWIRGRAVPAPRHAYRFLTIAETALMPASLLYPALLLAFLDTYLPTTHIGSLIPATLGLGDDIAEVGALAHSLVPVSLARISLLPPLLTLLILIMVSSRWLPLFMPAVTLGAMRVLIGLTMVMYSVTGQVAPPPPDATGAMQMSSQFNTLFQGSILLGGALMTAAAVYLVVSLLGVQDHFVKEDRRRLLRVDRDVVGNSTSLWLRGRAYAKEKAWAQAALHLRQSISQEPELAAYKLLVVAYTRLGDYGAATRTLDRAMPLAQYLDPEQEAGLPQLRAAVMQQQASAREAAPAAPEADSIPLTDPAPDLVQHPNLPLSVTLPPIMAPNPESFAHPDAALPEERRQTRDRLLALVEADENNVEAWVRLSHVVDTDEEQEICLENALTLDPEHVEARERRAALKQRMAYLEASTWDPAAPPASGPRAATLAGDILGEAYREKHTVISPQPSASPPGCPHEAQKSPRRSGGCQTKPHDTEAPDREAIP